MKVSKTENRFSTTENRFAKKTGFNISSWEKHFINGQMLYNKSLSDPLPWLVLPKAAPSLSYSLFFSSIIILRHGFGGIVNRNDVGLVVSCYGNSNRRYCNKNPDPTAGPSAGEQTTWCLDEVTLHENIKKTLVKFCVPSPVVLRLAVLQLINTCHHHHSATPAFHVFQTTDWLERLPSNLGARVRFRAAAASSARKVLNLNEFNQYKKMGKKWKP